MKQMDAVETKEIRGLSLKALLWLIGSTVSIVTTIILTYAKLESKIEINNLNVVNKLEITDIRIKTVEADLQTTKNDLNSVRNEFNAYKNAHP